MHRGEDKAMLTVYNGGSGAIETVYTYEEWLKEFNRQQSERRNKRRTECLYYIKLRLAGLVMAASGIVIPFLFDGDITFSLFALPLGIFLVLTKERVTTF